MPFHELVTGDMPFQEWVIGVIIKSDMVSLKVVKVLMMRQLCHFQKQISSLLQLKLADLECKAYNFFIWRNLDYLNSDIRLSVSWIETFPSFVYIYIVSSDKYIMRRDQLW